MKKIFTTIWLVLFGLSTANATSLHPDTFLQVADLITWDFAVDGHLRTLDVTGGKVKINPVTKIASLTFDLANDCPVDAHCFVSIPEFKIELPIIKITRDRCGVITYVAERDLMPVDGALEKLVIKDTTSSVCEMFYSAATTISYDETYVDRIEHRTETRHSRMTAEKLQSPFVH
ncbi:MAG: hypothetical protein A2X86_09595 [Bdellovibrionales bacterium GWA2_49_15]|nr:MAG: hypothetical protein A2X86_09595 [Bdellovibrionales bacterium GWA2_49_15]HAZ13033.1 hypothetical protein [Bdellovibrionales bacterium]